MYNCRQPPCESLGFRSRLTPRQAAGGFDGGLGHEGCKYGLRNEWVSQCEVLHELQVGREREQRLLQERGKAEAGAAKGVRCPEGEMCPPSPGLEGRDAAPGDLLHHLVPVWGREHGAVDEVPWAGVGTAWVAACIKLIEKCLPPPPQKGAAYRLRQGDARSGAASKGH